MILTISNSIDTYKEDTVVQSLPSLANVNRAKKCIERNKYADAEKILTDTLEITDKDALVYKYLGLVYERTGRLDLAVENYQKSADIDPQDKSIWQKLGFALVSTGQFERAEKSFENANKVQAGNSDTFTGWGMALMKMQNFPAAHEKFAIASKINKYNFSAVFLGAVMEIKLGLYDKAESKLMFLVGASPNESNTFELARLKAIKNDFEDTVFYAQKSLAYNPNMLPAYILLGQVYAEKSEKEKSLESFEKADEKNLASPSLYLEWGKALEKFERHAEAKAKLLKALEWDGENIETLSYLALCHVSLNEFEEAKPILNKVLEKEPENKTAKRALAITEFENGNIDDALKMFRADDENAVNCYYIAKCYEKKGDDTKVREYYNSAIFNNNRYTTAYIDYAKYLIDKEDYAEAQRKLRKALKSDENNVDLLNLMFYVSYILVKVSLYEYNVKETLSIAEKIESLGTFEYPEQKQELMSFLRERD